MEKMCMQHLLREPGLPPLLQSGGARKCWIGCLDVQDFSGESACCAGSLVDVVVPRLPKLLNHDVPFGLTELSRTDVAVFRAPAYCMCVRHAFSTHSAPG
jgi:hypothetical protein